MDTTKIFETPVAVIPKPVAIERTEGSFELKPSTRIATEDNSEIVGSAAQYLAEFLSSISGCEIPILEADRIDSKTDTVLLSIKGRKRISGR